jgi:hypothetical protein
VLGRVPADRGAVRLVDDDPPLVELGEDVPAGPRPDPYLIPVWLDRENPYILTWRDDPAADGRRLDPAVHPPHVVSDEESSVSQLLHEVEEEAALSGDKDHVVGPDVGGIDGREGALHIES